ncbi:PAS domain-containing protein [Psychroflexus planctonicus]|uniref:histidine kinase n=1 Tax=Psychroflexus planctonicus TaxID=1526575 RepID=A0ABQ1SCH3_9FLAO|nr:PAS domain-containing protein [Psychroflexus planctonicus]GGE27959.1 hypothetical protein GCM10010832_05870 [Psychroflexus planctonicus]
MSKNQHSEFQRLKALYSYSIVDSVDEKEYDQITNLACLVTESPVALISLVENDRQWFKSSVGFNEKETPVQLSFCAHAIKENKDFFEVEDARTDNRFNDFPYVTGNPNLIYYAGVSLKTENGLCLGTLCVLDTRPKKLNVKQKDALHSLANQVMQLLELRMSKQLLKNEKDQFERFTELSHLIIYRYSEDGFDMYHNNRVEDILGYSPDVFANDVSLWTKLIHKDDIGKVRNAIAASKNGESVNVIYRMYTKSGDVKWIHDKSTNILSLEGNLIIEGLAEDITEHVKAQNELKQLNKRYQLAVDSSKDGIWEWELTTGKTFYSKTWIKNLGYDRSDLKEHIDNFFHLIHPEDRVILENLVQSLSKGQESRASIDFRIRHKNGNYRWFSARGSGIKDETGNVTNITGFTTDITRRKNIEEENKQVRDQLQKIMDMVPSYIYAKDEDGKFLMVNKAAADVFKLNAEQVRGKEVDVELTPLELRESYLETDRKVLETQKSLFIPEELVLKNDGTLGWFQTVKIPYQHPGSEQLGVLGVSTEITERKIMEQELRHTKDFLEQSGKMAKVGAWEIDLKKNTTRWSDTTKKIHEVEEDFEAYTEKAISFFKEGYNRNRINQLVEIAVSKGSGYDEELELITAKGNKKWVRCIGAIDKKDEEVVRLYGTIQDITEEKSREYALISAQQKLQSIFNEIESVVWSVKLPSHELLFITPSAEKVFGIPLSEWEEDSRKWMKFVHPQDNAVIDQTQELLKKHGSYDIEYRILDANNNTKWIRKRAKIIYDEFGNGIRLDGFITDITARKNIDLELNEVLEITQNQNDRLMNFAYIVSHNLRSHSANILSLIDLLKIEFKDFQNNEMFKMLQSASENLMETIEHLSEVALLSIKNQKADESINLKTTLAKVLESTSSLASKAKVEIINKSDLYYITGTSSYVESILMNLITNAIKYASPDRKSFIKIENEEYKDFIKVSIIDNGLGIDLKKYKNRLFKMYQTFHKHPEAKGIGLFILKNQIEAMRGKIEVDSILNEGSTFSVYFRKTIIN